MNKRVQILVFALGCLFVPLDISRAAGDTGMDGPDFSLTRITDRVHVVYGPLALPDERNRGFRNNAVIVLTTAGTVIFDPGGSAWAGEQLAAAARTISPQPVVAVFNSHAHGDHWLGNEGIRRAFPHVAIYGHPRTKRRIGGPEGQHWLDQIERLTAGKAGGEAVVAPTKVVNDGDLVGIGDRHFRIHHTGPAHTDSDIMVEIVEEKVLFTGDIVRNGMLGLMESDSSFAGNISTIDTILAMDLDHYIPGHGISDDKEALTVYRTYLDTLLTTVRALYAEGLADFEMKRAVGAALSPFSKWEGFQMRLGAHVSRAFLEVEAEDF